MDAFVKSFATWRTIKKATVLIDALVLDSLDQETSSVTVEGTEIGRSNTGDWLIVRGQVYLISLVKPQKDRTTLTLTSPLEAFSRPLERSLEPDGATVGGFVGQALEAHWAACDDPQYAMPYLTVESSDTTAFVEPELDSAGCFSIPEYFRLMRKAYRIRALFTDTGKGLHCQISVPPAASRKISFEDGRSQLQSVDYSASGVAKITAIQDVDTGEKDEDGEKILRRERSVWYLAEDGSVSQIVPARRASGGWDTILVNGNQSVEEKVVEAFAKNKRNHKLEFWSTIDLQVTDDCEFFVYGELLSSYISYKRVSNADSRYYYKSGELATTATEKLRGVTK